MNDLYRKIKAFGCPEALAIWKEKPTVRYCWEFVEKTGIINNPRFRHFIYVNLGIAVDRCKNLPFTCKNA